MRRNKRQYSKAKAEDGAPAPRQRRRRPSKQVKLPDDVLDVLDVLAEESRGQSSEGAEESAGMLRQLVSEPARTSFD